MARKIGSPRRGRLPNERLLQERFWPEVKWRCFLYHCHDFRFYFTFSPKRFSNFRSRYLFDIGLPTLYLTLADTYLPIDTAFPNSATLLVPFNETLGFWLNGLSPSLAQYSYEKGLIQQWVCFEY